MDDIEEVVEVDAVEPVDAPAMPGAEPEEEQNVNIDEVFAADRRADSVAMRAESMDVREANTDQRTIRIAVSSERPYLRSFGNEILDHSASSIDMEFLRSGRAPLLLDHNQSLQIGVIESVSLDPDKVLRATVRFSRSALAEEVFQDVLDGIRSNVSIGYRVNKMAQEGKGAYRVTSWSPMEVSVVSIPADPSVGVGRSASAPPEVEPAKIEPSVKKDTHMEEVNLDAVRAEAAKAAYDNAAAIVALGARHNRSDLAQDAIRTGQSLDQFRGALLEVIGDKPLENLEVGLTAKERKRFSLVRAIHALANPTDRRAQEAAAFEFECSHAAARQFGATAQGVMLPIEVMNNWTRDLNSVDDGKLVATDLRAGDFVDVLRNSSSVMQAGARMLTGLTGNVSIPTKTAASTAAWISPEGGDSTKTEPEFGQIALTPKTVGAYTEMTRQLIIQSSLSVESLVRDDLAQAIALMIDAGALKGTGLTGQPKGITATTGINTKTFALAVPTWSEVVALETLVATGNALTGNLHYIMGAPLNGELKTAKKDAGSGLFISDNGSMNGYTNIVSNQMAANKLLFGNFSEVVVGLFSGLDITVDPYSNSKSGTVRIVALQSVDVGVRHATSFALGSV